ncbi:MAG: DUF1552 domain-containing protein, partial [Acidobacteria bacterium]|nr:DUF1552 domain-containing protein [Acidobacteriota bacterium]
MAAFLSRRTFLKTMGLAGAVVRIGLPPLAAMFNSNGTAYAGGVKTLPKRFVLWFNGNGIPEKYWIPRKTGAGFEITPCLSPLAPFRDDIHVFTGLDSPAARVPQPGNSHYPSMSALVSGQPFTGRGADRDHQHPYRRGLHAGCLAASRHGCLRAVEGSGRSARRHRGRL